MARSVLILGEREVVVGSRDRTRGRCIHETHSSLEQGGGKEGAALKERWLEGKKVKVTRSSTSFRPERSRV